MSGGTSETRFCESCGYIFSPLETECPKCARMKSAPPAASGEVTARDEPYERASASLPRPMPKILVIVGAIVIGHLLLAAVIAIWPLLAFAFWFPAGMCETEGGQVLLAAVVILALGVPFLVLQFVPFDHEIGGRLWTIYLVIVLAVLGFVGLSILFAAFPALRWPVSLGLLLSRSPVCAAAFVILVLALTCMFLRRLRP